MSHSYLAANDKLYITTAVFKTYFSAAFFRRVGTETGVWAEGPWSPILTLVAPLGSQVLMLSVGIIWSGPEKKNK